VTNTLTTSFDCAWSPDGRQIAYVESRAQVRSTSSTTAAGKHRVTHPLMVDLGVPALLVVRRRTLAFTGGSGGAGWASGQE
jgi:hypothetical protein